MARLSRFVMVAALLGGATVSLSACTGGSDPVVSPSPSVSVSVTPTPSVSPSPTPLSEEELLALIPEDARGEDFLSASNFAKFFVQEYDVMFQVQDDELFRYMTGADCEFCASSLASYTDLIEAGGRREGGAITPSTELSEGGLNEDGYWYAGFAFQLDANTDYDGAAQVVETSKGGAGHAYVKLEYSSDHWVVQGVTIEMDA